MDLIFLLPVLIFSVILHEVSHGWVALSQGDDTAFRHGRLTLNPLPHIDPIGSVVFPAICMLTHLPIFGWAKPVPVNPNRFTNYRSGSILVSLAGPLANFLVALLFTLMLYLVATQSFFASNADGLSRLLSQAILLNLVLFVFNLIPIPPLDGSRVVSVLLPGELGRAYDSLEPYGFFIVMGLIVTGIIGKILFPLVTIVYIFLMKMIGAAG